MEKIRRNEPDWGEVLHAPNHRDGIDGAADADSLVTRIDSRMLEFWKWEAFYRGLAVWLAALTGVACFKVMSGYLLATSDLFTSDAAHGLTELDTQVFIAILATLVLTPFLVLASLLLTPRTCASRFLPALRKVYGSAGLTGLGGWVELDFDEITAVSVIERRYHQGGRTTTYSLWLCEVDPITDRIVKRIVVMQPSRVYNVPAHTWEFIRAYMNKRPEQVPPVKLWRRGTSWPERVSSANIRLFGSLLDDNTLRLQGPFSRAFAVILGTIMYPWEITGWALDRLLRERRAPPALREALKRSATHPNPYQIKGDDEAERAKIRSIATADSWVHAAGIVLSILFYGCVFWLWTHAGRG